MLIKLLSGSAALLQMYLNCRNKIFLRDKAVRMFNFQVTQLVENAKTSMGVEIGKFMWAKQKIFVSLC